MLVSRAPLRISLGGGGTDLPAYASKFGGYCVTASINKYVRVVLNPSPDGKYRLHYRETETTDTVDEIKHPLFRECLRGVGACEIASFADLPAESGLGSSSAFAVAMAAAIRPTSNLSPYRLRGEWMLSAARVEQKLLGEPVGMQDHFASAFGGIRSAGYADEGVYPESIYLPHEFRDSLMIFSSGKSRKASGVLTAQKEAIDSGAALSAMHRIKELGHATRKCLMARSWAIYGEILKEHWALKRSVGKFMSDPEIDLQHEYALAAGAIGGKLMGAGGGGYWLFSVPTERQSTVRFEMARLGCKELENWDFESEGVQVQECL